MKTTNKQVVHLENRSGHIYFRPTTKPDRTGDYDITITTKHYKVLVSGTVTRSRGKALYQLCKDSEKPYMDLFTGTDTALIMKEAAETEVTESQTPMYKQECKQEVDCYDGPTQIKEVTTKDLEDEIKKYRKLLKEVQDKNIELRRTLNYYRAVMCDKNNTGKEVR
jgi:SpoVK/Ycf46/Vps4 family AAA+-type ATPase